MTSNLTPAEIIFMCFGSEQPFVIALKGKKKHFNTYTMSFAKPPLVLGIHLNNQYG